MKSAWSRIWAALGVAAVVAACAGEAAADRVIMKSGQVMEAGSVRYRSSDDSYVVQAETGIIPIPRRNVERVEVAKPARFDEAARMVENSQFDAAIPLLEEIVSQFLMLEWDDLARDLLAQCFAGKGDFRRAVNLYRELFEKMPAERVPLALRRRYWKSLEGAQQFSTLKTELDTVIAGGNRDVAALAQLIRGDMYLAQGQKQDALYDYLRTVVLYEQVKEVQPEALFKAAQMLEELRDPRATDLRKKLVADFPASDYAKRVRTTL